MSNKLSLAARLDIVLSLSEPQPIFCACKDDCDVVVGHTEPIITREQATELLGLYNPTDDKDVP